MRRRKNVKGFIYLLHFSEPYKHARHYTGWAKDADRRVAEHIEGGAKCNPLVKAASAAGIRIEVARIYEGKTRIDERHVPANSYKAQTEAARLHFGEMVPYAAYIAMKTAQGYVVPWLASQTDLLSEDWIEVA